MKKEVKPTSCCNVTAYSDPIYIVGGTPSKKRIGSAARCSSCHRLLSDAKMDYPNGDKEMVALQKKFNGTSWALMVDKLIKQPGAALNFEVGTAGINP